MGMNNKTRLMFNLAYIYSYIKDIRVWGIRCGIA